MSVAGVIGLFRGRPAAPRRRRRADGARRPPARAARPAAARRCWCWSSRFDRRAVLLRPAARPGATTPTSTAATQLDRGHRDRRPTINGVGGPLLLQLKLCGVAAIVVTSPYWLYQIWAFIVPGPAPPRAQLDPDLRRRRRPAVHRRRRARLLRAAQGPRGADRLHPGEPARTWSTSASTSRFLTRMLLVFGIAFEIPLFVVLLNLAGVVSGKTLGSYRPWIIIGTFVFAAVATPSTDPFSMLMLAVPMMVLFLVSEVIARLVDAPARPGRRTPGSPTTRRPPLDGARRRPPLRAVRGRGLTVPVTHGVEPSTRSTCPSGWAPPRSTWTAADRRPRRATRSRAGSSGAGRSAGLRPAGRRRGLPASRCSTTTWRRQAHQAWTHGQVLLVRVRRPADPGGARHGVLRRPGAGDPQPAGQGRRRPPGPLRGHLRL